MRKFIKRLHLWLSVPFGLIISITCFTGAILIFEDDITHVIQHEYYYVDSVEDKPLSFAELVNHINQSYGSEQVISSITAMSDPEHSWRVNISAPKRATIYVNQYSGEVLGTPKRLTIFSKILRLHRWLLDERPNDGNAIFWGKRIVGVSTLVMVLIVLTGVVLWFPKSVKIWKIVLRLHLEWGGVVFFTICTSLEAYTPRY